MSAPTATAAPSADGPDRSLIQEQARQLSLPGLPTEADWQASETATVYEEGEYTGQRLFSRAPQVYQAIVELAAADVSIRVIARVLHVHTKTVMGVMEREPLAIATAKERLSRRLFASSLLTIEIIRDQLAALAQSGRTLKVDEIKSLGILLGIQTEKALLTAGEATWRGEVIKPPEPGHDDYNRFIEAQAVEVESTGLAGETRGAKEAGELPPAPATPSAALAAGAGSTSPAPAAVNLDKPTEGTVP